MPQEQSFVSRELHVANGMLRVTDLLPAWQAQPMHQLGWPGVYQAAQCCIGHPKWRVCDNLGDVARICEKVQLICMPHVYVQQRSWPPSPATVGTQRRLPGPAVYFWHT